MREKYLLGYSERETLRLQQQAQDLARDTEGLLNQIGVGPGERVLDLGCGPQGSLEVLAKRVGPSGSVVGLEKSAQAAALARAFVRERGFAGIEIAEGDARASGLPRASFDLVHARLVLVNVPKPEEIVREMVALARPGGVVASHEADYAAHRCDPPHPSWDRLFAVYEAYSRDNGIDLFIGRRTHSLFRAAGLINLRVHPLIHVYPPGHPRRGIFLDFIDNVRAHLIADGWISVDELDAHIRALHEHIARPDVLIISHMFFQVWGRTS
jgi:ubiquinone/menaquinone biosynthesis C-methylase UbiE